MPSGTLQKVTNDEKINPFCNFSIWRWCFISIYVIKEVKRLIIIIIIKM